MSQRFPTAFKFNLIKKLTWEKNGDLLTPYNNLGQLNQELPHPALSLVLIQLIMEDLKNTAELLQRDTLLNQMIYLWNLLSKNMPSRERLMELQMENSISINQVHLQSPTKLLELISDSLERKRKSSLLVNLILSGIIMTLSIKVSLMSLKEPRIVAPFLRQILGENELSNGLQLQVANEINWD